MSNINWDDPTLVTAVRASIARRQGEKGRGMPVEDLLDRVDPDDPRGSIDGLLDDATLSSAGSRLLLDTKRFPEVEPVEPADRLSGGELEKQWERLQARLQAPTGVVEEATAPAFSSSMTRLRTLAAIFALACVALTLMLIGRGFERLDSGSPTSNLALVSLIPEFAETPRQDGSPRIELADRMNGVFLVLTHALALEFADYGIEIRDSEGRLVWESRGLRQDAAGFFTVLLPRDLLTAGRYQVGLSGYRGSEREALAAYSFTLAR